MKRSISEYFYEPGGAKGHHCGYCKSEDTNCSNGMWTHQLTCEDYQDLIDRGWRRSGKYCYKPVMDKTCCPLYTIRCESTKFQLSKSQKKVLKKMNDFLLHGRIKQSEEDTDAATISSKSQSHPKKDKNDDSVQDLTVSKAAAKRKEVRPGLGPDPSKPSCRKAKLIRQERKQQKMAAKAESAQPKDMSSMETSMKSPPKSAVSSKKDDTAVAASSSQPDFLKIGSDGRKPLELFLSPSSSNSTASPTTAHHTLDLELVQSSPPSPRFTATFKESCSLFKKYQMAVHHDKEDDCTENQFRRFLCDSPLIPKKGAPDWSYDYGSYHHQYRIDGKLIAVGVVDILPKCLSSVYVFYDPDYDFLKLGVYSALRELELSRKLYLGEPVNFKYYYMGYYIHDCVKMRYKGEYYPSYLLCPVSYCFVPIEQCRPKLDVSKFSRLNEEHTEPEKVEDWLGKVIVLFQNSLIQYGVFKTLVGDRYQAKVKEYAEFVGPAVASRMVLFLD